MRMAFVTALAGSVALASATAVVVAPDSEGAGTTDTVTLQFKWVTEAQFAGYYVVRDRGFYGEVGLGWAWAAETRTRPPRSCWGTVQRAAAASGTKGG